MSAFDTLVNISKTNLLYANLRYCLVTAEKLPIKFDGTFAKPNNIDDFSTLNELYECKYLNDFSGIGISIQASNICAIDVDKCFYEPFDITSIDERGFDILNLFKDIAYCEFSFSGKGLRILFKHPNINDYSNAYYIKNSNTQIEYYQPTKSFRYVTITGKSIYDNPIQDVSSDIIFNFLNKYMKKSEKTKRNIITKNNNLDLNTLKLNIKRLYFKNLRFQDLWFGKAPGSGKNESELDFELLSYLYEEITQDFDKLRVIFESSPYYQSKDWKHINKWKNQDYRYYNYIYEQIQRRHI